MTYGLSQNCYDEDRTIQGDIESPDEQEYELDPN